ncbi:MAG: hypothetical protein EXR86_05075 [Gammaproteobacteria bacterium]|nr:hypothetical protein [Gammaproteobacteria bacterium]
MESLNSLAFSGLSALAFFRMPADTGGFESSMGEHRRTGMDRAEAGRGARRGEHAAHHQARSVTECVPNGSQPAQPATEPQGFAALSFSHSDRTTLFITTQDGDTVRLKIKTRESISLDTNEQEAGDRLLTEFTLQAQSSTKVSFVVNGDLSADELGAIRSVVEQAGAIAQEFFAGDLQSAFAAAADFNIDATQLAIVGFRMSSREQLTYTQSGTPRPLAALPTTPAAPSLPAASSLGAVAEPVVPVTEDLQPSVIPTAAPVAPSTNGLGERAPQIGEVLGSIKNFLSSLIERLGTPAQSGDAPAQSHLDISLKLKIFQSMLVVGTLAPGSDETALPVLVPETLDALAAQQAPALHATA